MNGMREQGRLTEWNDARGFGFITPLGGGPRVFAHVSEFPRDLRRPMATDLVTYDAGHDERGRAQAHHVEYMTPAHARHEEQGHPLGLFEVAFPGAFAVLLALLVVLGKIPVGLLWFYLVASIVGFAMYWQDKVAATSGKWRTSEATLLGVALIGGWPGAFIARHVFRHKTRKQPFRAYFWLAVATHCGFLAFVIVALAQASV